MPLKIKRGFTLIEIMVVIAIVSLLAAIALPAYKTFLIRAKIIEGLSLSSMAKLMVFESASNVQNLVSASIQWNAQSGGSGAVSKYVQSVQITVQGEILIVFKTASGVSAGQDTLVFSPYVRNSSSIPIPLSVALTSNQTGSLDWSCASNTQKVAASRGMTTMTIGTLPSEYAPAECR